MHCVSRWATPTEVQNLGRWVARHGAEAGADVVTHAIAAADLDERALVLVFIADAARHELLSGHAKFEAAVVTAFRARVPCRGVAAVAEPVFELWAKHGITTTIKAPPELVGSLERLVVATTPAPEPEPFIPTSPTRGVTRECAKCGRTLAAWYSDEVGCYVTEACGHRTS
jgi:hypothetical protein